jgi:hypothetical protein
MNGSRSKILSKNLVRQRCAEEFNFGFKELKIAKVDLTPNFILHVASCGYIISPVRLFIECSDPFVYTNEWVNKILSIVFYFPIFMFVR